MMSSGQKAPASYSQLLQTRAVPFYSASSFKQGFFFPLISKWALMHFVFSKGIMWLWNCCFISRSTSTNWTSGILLKLLTTYACCYGEIILYMISLQVSKNKHHALLFIMEAASVICWSLLSYGVFNKPWLNVKVSYQLNRLYCINIKPWIARVPHP